MTFNEIVQEVKDRLGRTSPDATARIGRLVNARYRRVTSSLGLQVGRRVVALTGATTQGVATVTFSGIEKIERVIDDHSGTAVVLEQITLDELRETAPDTSDAPAKYAIQNMIADSVTIRLDVLPQTSFNLKADGLETATTLSGSTEPRFPESFHDLLVEGVIADELRKDEKLALAKAAEDVFSRRLSELRLFIAKNGPTLRQTQTDATGSGSSSGSSSSATGATSYTQTGLITFDRDPSAPFAVTASSAVVPNLDADKVDGYEASALAVLAENETITGSWTFNALMKFADNLIDIGEAAANRVRSIFVGTSVVAPLFQVGGTTSSFPAIKRSGAALAVRLADDSADAALTAGAGTFSGAVQSTTLTPTSGQVVFPATQNAAAGANTLDDYEEGSWTPVLGGSGGTSGQTYTTQYGRYVKIGKWVFASCHMVLSAKGTITASVQIQGLPFAAVGSTTFFAGGSMYWHNLATNWVHIQGFIQSNASVADLQGANAAAASTATALVTADINNNSQIIWSVAYEAAN